MDQLKCHSGLRPQRRLKWQPVRFDIIYTQISQSHANTYISFHLQIYIIHGDYVIAAGPSECEDRLAGCDVWFDDGFCEHSADLMSVFCRKTCGFCSTRPEGTYIIPRGLIGIFHSQLCNKNCDLYIFLWTIYKVCLDVISFCPQWASSGLCIASQEFMLANCPKSCDFCKASYHWITQINFPYNTRCWLYSLII